jgi:DNA-directed RNA polymerase I, II, and III subunit RPABC2
MSDYEDNDNYDSDRQEEADDDSITEEASSKKTALFKPVIAMKKKGLVGGDDDDDDAANDDEEVDEDEDEDEEQVGGADEEDDDYEDATEDDGDDDNDEIDINEDGEAVEKPTQNKSAKTAQKPKRNLITIDDEDEDYDEDEDNYLQKFDSQLIKNYVDTFHPECFSHNYEEIAKMSVVIKNADGIIIDPLHRTIPYLTKYEKARVIGQRAKQLETGANPLVKVPESIIDGYIIAELELREKKLPFIIRRPIPSGGCEYWNLRDLEQITY